MSKTTALAITLLTCFLLVLTALSPAVASIESRSTGTGLQDCPTSSKTCQIPVKSLGSSNNCECFACSFGTKEQHIRCAKDENMKAELRKLVEPMEDTSK
jgi:hypothetical protein